MRKFLLSLVLLLAVLAGGAYAFRGDLALLVMKQVLARSLGSNALARLPDGLNLLLCGSGSPFPDPNRAGPCVAVAAGANLYVIDSGSGGVRNLLRMNVPPGTIRSVLLTHFHSDHIDGLGEMAMVRWASAGNREPLPVLGPEGVEAVVAGFNMAYAQDAKYRHAHHGDTVAPESGTGMLARTLDVPEDGSLMTVIEEDGLRISAFAVDHRPVSPALGYRFDYKGRSLVISGDTKKAASVERNAQGVDLLVHEALAPNLVGVITDIARTNNAPLIERITKDILDYHASPVEAAEIAASARVRALLLYHIVPALPLPGLDVKFLEGVSAAFAGPVTLGRDGTLVSMPANSTDIRFSVLP